MGDRDTRGRVEWALVAGSAVAAGALGFVGFTEHFGARRPALDSLYLTLQLFTLDGGSLAGPLPWTLELARFLAPALTVCAAVKAGAVLFRDQLRALRARSRRGHAVVCGLGSMGLAYALDLRRTRPVVVVERDPLGAHGAAAAAAGCLVLTGD
ncbi:MAG: hypothetical protein ACYDA8_12670, partial [Deferrisomatales bacterium]